MEKTYSDAEYWKSRWIVNDIGFHKDHTNPMLVKHIERLTQNRQRLTVFVPLSGKSKDISWLSNLGHQVVGVEYYKSAIEEFFNENNIKFNAAKLDSDFELFTSENGRIRIYSGDFFKFDRKYEHNFDCVWDRGGLVALPNDQREKYAPHILKLLANNFTYLLSIIKYDTNEYAGPPHYVKLDELERLFGKDCKIEQIDEDDYKKYGTKQTPSREQIFLLTKNN